MNIKVVNKRYEILHKVADGGMGELYKVRDRQLNGAIRALKLLKHAQLGGTEQSIKREAYLLLQLHHRCLPHIFDYSLCEESNAAFLVMEWIDGIHLGQWLQRYSKSLNLAFLYYVAIQVLDALAYLHAQEPPIIHRDLKPSNIMLCKDGAVKLIDFGISKQLDSGAEYTIAFGTKGYAAPEQLLGRGTDERSDIYSFGAVLLCMLGIDPSLVYAFEDENRQLRDQFSMLNSTLNFHVPKALRELIMDCMQNQPAQRPLHTLEVRDRLMRMKKDVRAINSRKSRADAADMLSEQLKSSQEHVGKRIAIIGTHAGAGSTLIALALASCCEQQRIKFSYIEHRSKDAELFYCLQHNGSGSEEFSLHARSDLDMSEDHEKYGLVNVVRGAGSYWINSPLAQLTQSQRVSLTCRLAKQSVMQRDVLIDYSSHWDGEQLPAMLQHADCILIVNSPWMISQAPLHMGRISQVLQLANQQQRKVIWISNRDQAFSGRKEWLQLHGGLEHIVLPELQSKILLNEWWSKPSFPPHSNGVKALKKYLMPLIKKVIYLQ